MMSELPTQEPITEYSRVHKLVPGDNVQYTDHSSTPPVVLFGVVDRFTNPERTYVVVKFSEDDERELTEDELHRTGG